MSKYIIDSATLDGLADALREVSGDKRTYTPAEMIEAVTTILDSATYILVDENGRELPAVFVENETIFDATANDIRAGRVAVTSEGVTVGTKDIPAYHTTEGFAVAPAGNEMEIFIPVSDRYDFTKLQAIICPYNTSTADSVAAEKVSIDGNVYEVGETTAIAAVAVDHESKTIKLGITNEGEHLCVIRYFTYKEEY